MKLIKVHQAGYKIRSSEIGKDQKIKPYALVQLMQEASMEHVVLAQASAWDEALEGMTWVLLRKEIHFYQWPSLGEEIKVITYPSGFERIFAYRDYLVENKDGQRLTEAASTWTLIHKKTRNLVSIPEKFLPFDGRSEMNPLPRCGTAFPRTSQWKDGLPYRIGLNDLDWNGHMNNVQYVRFIMEDEEERTLQKKPKNMTLHFRQEGFHGDHVRVQYGKSDSGSQNIYRIIKEKESVLFQAAIEW
ncbi:MAG TPA: thioesterase [Saprospiraceae bacterium]|nr:thioesterase [Saprospiraceae bacterium]